MNVLGDCERRAIARAAAPKRYWIHANAPLARAVREFAGKAAISRIKTAGLLRRLRFTRVGVCGLIAKLSLFGFTVKPRKS